MKNSEIHNLPVDMTEITKRQFIEAVRLGYREVEWTDRSLGSTIVLQAYNDAKFYLWNTINEKKFVVPSQKELDVLIELFHDKNEITFDFVPNVFPYKTEILNLLPNLRHEFAVELGDSPERLTYSRSCIDKSVELENRNHSIRSRVELFPKLIAYYGQYLIDKHRYKAL